MLHTKNALELDQINELNALVSLIDEPNDEMFVAIRQKVLSYGVTAIPVLEEAWVNTFADSDSQRIESIIEDIRRSDLSVKIFQWLESDNPELLDGYLHLMRYLKPDFDESSFKVLFEKIYREVWLELNENLTALEKVKVFNHVIYKVNAITNIQQAKVKSSSYYLSYLEENNIGNSILIGSLYISVAQKLNIPIYGVDLPDNFVLVYMDDIVRSKSIDNYTKEDVLFYINPGNNGAVFTHNEIKHFLTYKELNFRDKYFLPVSNEKVLTRVIKELASVFENENSMIKKDGLESIILKLTQG
jgi:regulator of sirC expression with transglutaminase-like and TPR domain